jgi:cytochrome c-type biogenesis protein CcmH
MTGLRKPTSLLLSLLVGTVLLALLAGCSGQEEAQSLDTQAQDIFRSLMCPICPGQTIDQSQSELSAQMRAIVREKLEQGETKEDILQFFVERYGEAVLAAPVKTGFNLVVWVVPFVAVVAGGIVLWLIIRRWVRRGREPVPEAAMAAQDDADDERYRELVERELKGLGDRDFRR